MPQPMTINDLWEKWEGKVIDGTFPLQRWLGNSDHSAVFLTERGAAKQKAAIKLVPANGLESNAQLFLWAEATKLSHPHLIRLFEFGRCQVDGVPYIYVVMEYAEETLAEILPLRALSSDEAFEMLGPSVEALAALHGAAFVHARLQPSNVMAVDNQLKLSTDGIRKIGERNDSRVTNPYQAPEVGTTGLSPATDMWSVGMTLLAALSRIEPGGQPAKMRQAVPEAIPQPLHEILRRCLQVDPTQRATANEILKLLSSRSVQSESISESIEDTSPSRARAAEPILSQKRLQRWVMLPIIAAALLFVAWIGGKLHHPPAPAPESHTVSDRSRGASDPQPSPSPSKQTFASQGMVHGSVLHQALPDVSRGAQNTIRGRIKVTVQVAVDNSGNVSEANLTSPGPSKYFAGKALAAARQFKFNPPQVDGKPTESDWVLRFQFGRTSTNVFPTETKP